MKGREEERRRGESERERESKNCGYARTEVCEQTDLWRRMGTSEGEIVDLTLVAVSFVR